MDKEFWLSKWDENQIGFHQDQYNQYLTDYLPNYLSEAREKPIVLVPLCGKTKDMVYMANLAQKVIGVEISEKACHDFFKENSLHYDAQKLSDEFILFRSLNIEIYCGDIFQLNAEVFNQCNLIYDRASLVALPDDENTNMRSKLYELYQKLIANNTRLFVITFEYDQSQMQGPPFSIPYNELEKAFQGHHIKHLASSKTNFGENKIDFQHNVYEVRN